MDVWRNDPITCTELEEPYLASDGITYSRRSIEQAMLADAWHRSPVTGEILRAKCFRNYLIDDLLRATATATGKATVAASGSSDSDSKNNNINAPHVRNAETIFIYDERVNPLPENGGEITWTLPYLCTPQIASFKMKWKLDDDDKYVHLPLQLTARVLRDATGMDWLMHPPPPEEFWDDVLEIAKMFNVHKAVTNPWCLSTARLGSVSVEEQCFKLYS